MKTISIFAFSALLFIAGNVSAQMNHKQGMEPSKGDGIGDRGHMRSHEMIPNMTEEQKTKVKDLRIAFYKLAQPLHNQMEELKAKEHTLTTSEKPDIKAINANIDEITKVQNQLMKAMASHRQDIRSLLTEEQKIRFDSKPLGKRGSTRIRHGFANAGTPNSEHTSHITE